VIQFMTLLIDIFFIIFGCVAIIGVIIFLWNFGHKGAWGSMKDKYLDLDPEYAGIFDCESILIKDEDKWRYWNSCKVRITDKGVYIGQPKFLSWAVSSIFIPSEEIKSTYEFKKLFTKYTAISLNDNDYLIAIKSSHFPDDGINGLIKIIINQNQSGSESN